MKITFERNAEEKEQGNVSIDYPYDGVQIGVMWEKIIEPALLGLGYSQEVIESLFK